MQGSNSINNFSLENAQLKFDNVSQVIDEIICAEAELGAAVSIYHNNIEVLSVSGGIAFPNGSLWKQDTLTTVWSCGKPVIASCLIKLIQEGAIKLDDPIASVWPEFGSNGKANATIRMVLNHTVGLPTIRHPDLSTQWFDWQRMIALLEYSCPEWEPGTKVGYHPYTFGWLVGEIVRRVSNLTIREAVHKFIAQPLSTIITVGAASDLKSLIAPQVLAKEKDATAFSVAARNNPNSIQAAVENYPIDFVDTERGFSSELCAANIVTNAQGLAKFYDSLLTNDIIIDACHRRLMTETSIQSECDATFLTPSAYGLGVMKSFGKIDEDGSFVLSRSAFGHVGAGGHFAFAEPSCGCSMAFTMRRMSSGLHIDERGKKLITAFYKDLGYEISSDKKSFERKHNATI